MSLFVAALLIILQILILKTCRLYNVFGSGASHRIHAQFMTQASALNNGKRIGLLRGAGTRFATWFYAMHRLLRQKRALYATVHSPAFQTLAHNARVALAVQDIENSQFWRAIYCLMRAVFPALCAMRYCDANVPAMDKIYYLVKRVDYALLSSQPILNDEELFGPMYGDLCEGVCDELKTVFGESEEEFQIDDELR